MPVNGMYACIERNVEKLVIICNTDSNAILKLISTYYTHCIAVIMIMWNKIVIESNILTHIRLNDKNLFQYSKGININTYS